jgi:hypothetical protein
MSDLSDDIEAAALRVHNAGQALHDIVTGPVDGALSLVDLPVDEGEPAAIQKTIQRVIQEMDDSYAAAGAIAEMIVIRDAVLAAAALGIVITAPPTDGDLAFYSGGEWLSLGIGAEGKTLTVVSTLPAWASPQGGENFIGDLQAAVGELAFDFAIVNNQSQYEMANGVAITFDDADGIDAGSSSNYYLDAVGKTVTNQAMENAVGHAVPSLVAAGLYGVVQNLPIVAFTADGTHIRVQLISRAAGTVYDDVFISEVAGAGDTYDSAADITRLTFGGNDATPALEIGETIWSDWIEYELDETVAHLTSANCTAGGFAYVVAGGFGYHYKLGASDTGSQDRSGYTVAATGSGFFSDIETKQAAESLQLVSTPYVTDDNPEIVAIVLRFNQPNDDIAVGTDLTVNVTINDGITWHPIINLAVVRTIGQTVVCSGSVDISGEALPDDTVKVLIQTPAGGGSPKAIEITAFTIQTE